MSPDELAYYRERALFERRRASESTTKRAANIHLELACLYERIIELEEQHAPMLRIVEIGHPDELIGAKWISLAGSASSVPSGGRTSPKPD